MAGALAKNFDLARMTSAMYPTEAEASAAAEAMGCSGSHAMGDEFTEMFICTRGVSGLGCFPNFGRAVLGCIVADVCN